MGPRSILEATWKVKKSVQAAFGLLDASWSALGRLRAPKNLQKRIEMGPLEPKGPYFPICPWWCKISMRYRMKM